MTQVKIVTDSGSLLRPEEVEQYGITVVPLTVMIDGTIYQDGVTISREEFIDKMVAAENLPTTSQPSMGVFAEAYEQFEGQDVEVISIHLSKNLSGTVNAAEQAARMVNVPVTTVDSDFIDRAQAYQVIAAAKVAQAGGSVEEVLAEMDRVKQNTQLYLTVSDLGNLVAGGRLSKTAGFVAGLMNIQIGAHIISGKIEVEVKGRGAKAIKKYLAGVIEEMSAAPSGVKACDISYAGDRSKAEDAAALVNATFPDLKVSIAPTSPTVATHTGTGALGFSYEVN